MKKLLAVAVLVTTTAAFAADNRAIYDIQYLPNAGTTYGQTNWNWSQNKVKADAGDVKTNGWMLSQVIGHSFTDRLSVQAGINYASMTADPDGSKKVDQTGISDPNITARWRVMDDAWRLDIIGGADISLGKRKVDQNSQTAKNNYMGGSDLFLGAQIGQRWDKMQWSVLGQYTNYMKSTTDVTGQSSNLKTDSHGAWTLRADLLNQLSEKGFLRSHLTGMWTDQADGKIAGNDFNSAASGMWELGTQYQHMCSSDLLAYAGIDYRRMSQNTGNVDSNNTWIYTLGARYQF
jgi:hypothetical protein